MHGIHHELVQGDARIAAVRLDEGRIEPGGVLQLTRSGLAEATELGSAFEIWGVIEGALLDQVIPVHEVFGLHRFTFTRAGAVFGRAR